MPTGVFNLGACCQYCCFFAIVALLFVAATVGLPVGLVYGTELNGCCIALTTVLVAEAVIAIAIAGCYYERKN